MTVIIGLVDKDGTVYMGGDSAGTAQSGEQSVFENKKVFFPAKCPAYVIGFAGSFRMGQVLRYSLHPPPPPGPRADLERFMATEFVDSVRDCFKADGFARTTNSGREVGGAFLVGYQGKVFRIEDEYQVLLERRSYVCLGAAEGVALGAMYATEHISDPLQRLNIALAASAQFNAWVRAPYQVISLPYRDDWYQSKKRRRNG